MELKDILFQKIDYSEITLRPNLKASIVDQMKADGILDEFYDDFSYFHKRSVTPLDSISSLEPREYLTEKFSHNDEGEIIEVIYNRKCYR